MSESINLKKIFSGFKQLQIVVVGDLMLDKYVYGNVERISPEAPVPVLDVKNTDARAGGAANVAVNINALDAKPIVFSLIGNDATGDNLISILKAKGITTKHILRSESRITSTKTRIIAKNHQMMRIDEEVTTPLDATEAKKLKNNLIRYLNSEKPDALIFEDYDKGVLDAQLIEAIIAVCNQLNIPVIVDPKKRNFFAYANCTLFKPNIREINDSLGCNIQNPDIQSLNIATDTLHQQLPHQITMITLGDKGIYLRVGKKSSIQKAHIRNVADVSGAGDTVVSVAACCLASGISPNHMAAIANLAGGLVCEAPGVVPVNKVQLLKESIELLGSVSPVYSAGQARRKGEAESRRKRIY